MSRYVLVLSILIATAFCYPAKAVELLNNGDFSQNWTTGWERGSDARVVNPEVFSDGSKATLHLNGEGHFYLFQEIDVFSLDGLRFRASFKPNSIENLYGIGYAGFPYVGLGYIDKEGNNLGNTWCFSSEGFFIDLPGAQELPNRTSTRHYIQVSNNAWVTVEISIEQELQDHLPGIDPAKIDSILVVFGVSNSRSESEGIVEVDYVSLLGSGPSRVVSIVDTNQASGDSVHVVVNLDTNDGEENALGFSLTFDPEILTDPHVAIGRDVAGASLNSNSSQTVRGRFGIVISLPAGESLVSDTYQIVVVTFAVLSGATADSTMVGFGDQPIAREIVDANASALSSVLWLSGMVKTNRGYEADVVPRFSADRKCTIADWVQVGRFAARFDAIGGNEFQKTDCAPRLSLGDGIITIADWVQAGRYTARLDPLTLVGGPYAPSAKLIAEKTTVGEIGTSVVRVVGSVFSPGKIGSIKIELDSQGNENAIGFSLVFDPTVLYIENVTIGSGAANAMLNVNSDQSANGRIGIAMALPTGTSFNIGNQEILVVHFTVLRTATTITTTISFENEPIYREVVDIFANPITSSYSGATLTLMDIATFVEEENVQQEIPISFTLAQNFPNPFNAVTMIGFTLPEAGSILLSIYDLNGQMIRTVARGNYQPGRYKMVWDGCDDSGVIVASGIYLYSLKMTDRELTENRRMLLIR